MSGLELAASVIAVIDLSAKVASLCFQYSTDVKNASKDIERLRGEATNLKTALEGVRRLLEGPNGSRLSASREFLHVLGKCLSHLKTLEKKLEPGKTHRAIGRIGVRLAWPFKGNDFESIIENLGRCREVISLGLQVDQTYVADPSSTAVNQEN